ncbi:MAG: aminoglycoside phosphotransferase family protein [Caldilineaceae bacterium]
MTQDTSGTQDVLTYLSEGEKSAFAGQSIEIVDRWQGRDNLLWRFKTGDADAVLKLFMEAGQVRADRQFSGQDRFAVYGLAPRPHWQDRQPDPVPRPVLVYDWIEGDPFDPADPAQWDALADAVARIHSEDPGDHTRFSPHPVNLDYFQRVWQGSRQPLDDWFTSRQALSLHELFTQLWRQADQIMAAALPVFGETMPTLVHGDVTVDHLCLHRGQILLFDWELFGLGDPAQEAARILFYNQQFIDETVQARWLERYLIQVDDPSLPARVDVYRRILPFQSLTFLLNGIQREISNDPAQLADLEESRPFLVETISSALVHAAGTLLGDAPGMEQVEAEIDSLLQVST